MNPAIIPRYSFRCVAHCGGRYAMQQEHSLPRCYNKPLQYFYSQVGMALNFITSKKLPYLFMLVYIVLNSLYAAAQEVKRISIGDAIAAAKNNLQYTVNKEQVNKSRAQVNTAGAIPKTGIFAENEDMRPSDNKGILKIGLTQSIAWPGLYKSQKDLYSEQLKYYSLNNAMLDATIKRDVRAAYYGLWYLQDKQALYQKLDSIYTSLNEAAKLKVTTGDSPGLDSIAAYVKMKELEAIILQLSKDTRIQQQLIMQLLNADDQVLPEQAPLEKLPLPFADSNSLHPELVLQQQNIHIANAGVAVVKNENRPEFSGRFFSQRLYGLSNPFTGFSVTAAFPLFGSSAYRNKVRAAQAEASVQQKQLEYEQQLFITRQAQMQQEVEKNNSMLQFYEQTGVRQAEAIIKAATLAYRAGEISFAELSQFLTQAIDIQRNYLESLNNYNQSVIQYNYFLNQ